MSFGRLVLVTKPTMLEELRASFACSDDQLAFRLSTNGDSITEYAEAHAVMQASLLTLEGQLARAGLPVARISRFDVPTYPFRPTDIVVVMGPDGLFVNIATYLQGQPVVTVNPDPLRVDGVQMLHAPTQVAAALAALVAGTAKIQAVTLGEVVVNGTIRRLAVNEFFLGRRDHVSARYRLRLRGREERQSSSGILIAAGTGSTGWIRSVAAGAMAVTGGQPSVRLPFARDARQLVYAVREPFESKYTGISLSFGALSDGQTLEVVSEMSREVGMISSDGVLDDALEFPAGSVAKFSLAKQTVSLVLPP